ncbi:hypothetical protein F5Y07DRAFT_116734 [Xylaria sp. FL0933]|nr:hypothetical protein F5Y07DRAFT_116734 [Xylaria sp. FL0933]
MSGTASNPLTEHDELKLRACNQEEKCNTISNDLDKVITTSKERISSSMMDMMTEWKNLLEGAQVHEQKAIEWETRPEYRKKILQISDRLTFRTHEVRLALSNVTATLATTRTAADHLLHRAYEIEQSANELFSESSRLIIDLQDLEENVENTIQNYQLATERLVKKGEAANCALERTAYRQQETERSLNKTVVKWYNWENAHDISKFILLTYPLTKYKTKRHWASLSDLRNTQKTLTQDQQSHERRTREIQDVLGALKEAARILASIGTSTKATCKRADIIRTAARNAAQRTGSTINEASEIINAVGSMTLWVHGDDHMSYLQQRSSIIEVLQAINAHVNQSPDIYDAQVRAEARSLDSALQTFCTSEFVKVFSTQAAIRPELEMGEL